MMSRMTRTAVGAVALVAVTVLVAPPVMLLGAASPYALRLAVERVEESGTVAGRHGAGPTGSASSTALRASRPTWRMVVPRSPYALANATTWCVDR